MISVSLAVVPLRTSARIGSPAAIAAARAVGPLSDCAAFASGTAANATATALMMIKRPRRCTMTYLLRARRAPGVRSVLRTWFERPCGARFAVARNLHCVVDVEQNGEA